MPRIKCLSRANGDRLNAGLRAGIVAITAGVLLSGCGGPSVGDRFSQIFGSSSASNAQLVGTPAGAFAGGGAPGGAYADCPAVAIREGASTLQVGTKGYSISSNDDLRYQGTLVRNARDCTLSGGQVNARVGVEGRIIVGPAGAPSSVEVPLRVAVVQEGVQPTIIMSKLYRTTVDLGGQENVPFSFVAEDISYPAPSPAAAASYVVYIGFDPEGARAPAPKQKGRAAPRG